MIVWRERMVPPARTAVSGDVPDLFVAALEDAVVAVADRVVRRLATAGDVGGDPAVDELER